MNDPSLHLHSNHVVRACTQQLGDASVKLIPVALHEPVGIVLNGVVVVMNRELLQPRVRNQVLLVRDLDGAERPSAPTAATGNTYAG